MKKLVLLLAVTFSVSLFSCGGNDKRLKLIAQLLTLQFSLKKLLLLKKLLTL